MPYVKVDAARLGHAIKVYRTARDLSQMELGNLAGLSSGGMSLIERGVRNPSFEVLDAVAAALDTPVSELYRFAENGGGDIRLGGNL